MSGIDKCPNCGAALKNGAFGVNQLVGSNSLAALNLAFGENRTDSCDKCAGPANAIRDKLDIEIDRRRQQFIAASACIPIVSIPAPMGWDFKSIEIVSAQSVTGTGMFSDVASAFTDLFGTQSKTYNNKIKGGEDICKAALRLRAIELGGNAVVGVDIDYAEVGGQRAMLMVCMTGTAVSLLDPDSVAPDLMEKTAAASAIYADLNHYEQARQALNYY